MPDIETRDWAAYCTESSLDHYSVTTQKQKDCATNGKEWVQLTSETYIPKPLWRSDTAIVFSVIGLAAIVAILGFAYERWKRRR